MKMSAAAILLAACTALPAAAQPDPADWAAVLQEARGQTVYWHAWGGDPRINDFISWVGEEALARHGVSLTQVKLASTADAVARVVSEKQAGQDQGGAVDLIWINGENFAAMKGKGLLFGPFAEQLPNWPLVDVAGKPATRMDFTEPTLGLESPWAMAQLVFEYDSARVPEPPLGAGQLLDWAKANPGRFTYPQPPDYLGTTFLKQVLYGVIDDPELLLQPVDPASYDRLTAPLWAWLDQITPALWRQGRAYPANEPALGQLLADGEIDIAFAFNTGRASAAIAAGELPGTIRTTVWTGGTIGNASFVAIPYNAAHAAGAMVVANLLLDPQVQARAQDPGVLGFQTVLNLSALSGPDRARFDALDLGVATLAPDDLGPALPEPHASWMTRISQDWTRRYGVAQ
ncbi:MAG: ABC transporter substrate-binding protein [Rhodobacter sp.]|nr:ABC transporter substrate-binding protein [Rhodobacter sp.]MCA3513777.1 ABC transporter substrate-binding protein [Rhodobacter sp.]MCA3520003.1 ABC transporter substrate-binding protein [Rhodobacter sp.]MCA3523957.1 ABC transporter substrate-binding protein [Rhodobacter sp.]MCA3526614.1 ABC transporter substrate-binding protein [Rhodobacter sp.]